MRRTGRIALGIGISLIVGVVVLLLTLYVMVRVAPSTVFSSCGFSPPAHSCSPPVSPWGLLPIATSIIGMAAVGILLIRRRRGQTVPTSNRLTKRVPHITG